MKLVFFGSSDFSLHALQACIEYGHEIVLVVTTPPQQKGRGLQESPTPIQTFAESNGLRFIAPVNLKSPELLDDVKQLAPELFVVSSYGKIIPASWLKVPSRYALNVHPSLLPKYRGAAPIHWPIILGDRITGMSIAEVTPELDAGDLFYQQEIPIPGDISAADMTEQLGKASRSALKSVFDQLKQGALVRTVQNHDLSNYARKLCKGDGRIDWSRSASALENQIRGVQPWPVAVFDFNNEPVQVLNVLAEDPEQQGEPGKILSVERDAVKVQTGKGILHLLRVKPAGKKEMSAGDWARGKRIAPGQVLTAELNPPNFLLAKSYK